MTTFPLSTASLQLSSCSKHLFDLALTLQVLKWGVIVLVNVHTYMYACVSVAVGSNFILGAICTPSVNIGGGSASPVFPTRQAKIRIRGNHLPRQGISTPFTERGRVLHAATTELSPRKHNYQTQQLGNKHGWNYEERGSDWSHQVFGVGTTQRLQLARLQLCECMIMSLLASLCAGGKEGYTLTE